MNKANFPVRILPTICEPGHIAGKLSHKWHEIHEGVNVFVALGDMQCSILATQAQQMDVGNWLMVGIFIFFVFYIMLNEIA